MDTFSLETINLVILLYSLSNPIQKLIGKSITPNKYTMINTLYYSQFDEQNIKFFFL